MSCPACGSNLPGGQARCPACGANVAPMTEGALAPDPARARPEPLRELPGFKKREKTWKDEVRERVRDRKRRRGDGEGDGDLPLFRDGGDGEAALDGEAGGVDDVVVEAPPAPPARPPIVIAERHRMMGKTADSGLGSVAIELGVDESDLPLRPAELPLRAAPSVPSPTAEPEADESWTLGAEPSSPARPVERPAYSGERVQAAAVDLALLTVLWAVVVYFASRAAHVGLDGLRPAWPYLGGYLAFLGLTYAGYFTGTTGQTLGKIATGLRVVDAGGRPPGYLRAFGRAALGSIGVLAAGAGLIPMLLDPARRALHDRVSRTRVVKH
jgi:uncharacterized RDD family membrane protein YckC